MRLHSILLSVLALALAGPATAATKVSFGVVSPTATTWPGFIAAKKGFFAANGVEMDTVSIGVSPGMQAVASGSLNIMLNTCNAPVSLTSPPLEPPPVRPAIVVALLLRSSVAPAVLLKLTVVPVGSAVAEPSFRVPPSM